MVRQLHRLKHDILTRSYETCQFALACKNVFARENTINVNEGLSTEIDFEGMIPDTMMLPSRSPENFGISPTNIINQPFLLKFNFLLHHQMVYGL